MSIRYLANFRDEALLLLCFMVALIFFTSGSKHATNPEERSKDIEMGKGFTRFLGIAECAGALGVAFGYSHNSQPSGSFSSCSVRPRRKSSNGRPVFGGNMELTAGAATA
jgi:hypothetical protein